MTTALIGLLGCTGWSAHILFACSILIRISLEDAHVHHLCKKESFNRVHVCTTMQKARSKSFAFCYTFTLCICISKYALAQARLVKAPRAFTKSIKFSRAGSNHDNRHVHVNC